MDEVLSEIRDFDTPTGDRLDETIRFAGAVEAVMMQLLRREDVELRICDGRLRLFYAKSGDEWAFVAGGAGLYPRSDDWYSLLTTIGSMPEREPWYQ